MSQKISKLSLRVGHCEGYNNVDFSLHAPNQIRQPDRFGPALHARAPLSDDIMTAYASLPTSVRENSDLHDVHVLCARGGMRTVRGTCWGLCCTASSI
jgi:hypothetical protein